MSIAVDVRQSGGFAGPAGSLSWTHTVGSGLANALALVFVNYWSSNSTGASGVTFGGAAMSLLGRRADVNSGFAEIWYLKAPTAGAKTVVVSMAAGAGGSYMVAGSATYQGVNQATPFNAASPQSNNGAAPTQPSLNVTSAAGERVVDTATDNELSTDTLVAGAGQTTIYNTTHGSDIAGGASEEAGAASVTMSWSGVPSGTPWSHIAASLIPAGGGGAIVCVVSEASHSVDALRRVRSMVRVRSDASQSSELRARVRSLKRAVANASSSSESRSRVAHWLRSVANSSSTGETSRRVRSMRRAVVDALHTTETAFRGLANFLVVVVTDASHTIANVRRVGSWRRTRNDGSSTAEATGRRGAWIRVRNDAGATVETPRRVGAWIRSRNDASATGEQQTRLRRIVRVVVDVLRTAETPFVRLFGAGSAQRTPTRATLEIINTAATLELADATAVEWELTNTQATIEDE